MSLTHPQTHKIALLDTDTKAICEIDKGPVLFGNYTAI